MASNSVFSGGKGLFTAWDPSSALRANPPPKWVAVLPDKMTPQLAQSFRDKGIALVIWEPKASQAGVNAVNQYGAVGYIAQAEGPEELAAAQAVAPLIKVPKALVTNNFMPAYPPGWIAMPEAYTNNNPAATADQVTRDALARGATEVIPVIGLGFADSPGAQQMSAQQYAAGLAAAGAAGATGSAAYIAEQTSDADLNAYTGGKVPSGAAPPDGGGQQQGGQQSGSQAPSSPTTPSTPAPAATPPVPTTPLTPSDRPYPGLGSQQPHAPTPPTIYSGGGTTAPGPQMAEGGLGENWNLGWQVQPPQPPGLISAHSDLTAPYSVPHPFAPQQGGGLRKPGAQPGAQPPPPDGTQPPQPQAMAARGNALPYLNYAAGQILAGMPYLNPGQPALPPYLNYRYRGF